MQGSIYPWEIFDNKTEVDLSVGAGKCISFVGSSKFPWNLGTEDRERWVGEGTHCILYSALVWLIWQGNFVVRLNKCPFQEKLKGRGFERATQFLGRTCAQHSTWFQPLTDYCRINPRPRMADQIGVTLGEMQKNYDELCSFQAEAMVGKPHPQIPDWSLKNDNCFPIFARIDPA